MMLRVFGILLLALTSCGYHLVGQGEGVIPKSATQLWVVSVGGGDANRLLPILVRRSLLQREHLTWVSDDNISDTTVEIRLENMSEALVATAFDAAGLASQYRLTVSGSARMVYRGKEVWHSDAIAVGGDIFAAGGVVAIESQRAEMGQRLRQQWADLMVRQMYSTF